MRYPSGDVYAGDVRDGSRSGRGHMAYAGSRFATRRTARGIEWRVCVEARLKLAQSEAAAYDAMVDAQAESLP